MNDPRLLARLRRTPTVLAGVAVLCLIALVGLAAPLLTPLDPAEINPAFRNKTPGAVETVRADDGTKSEVRHWLGTDSLGRDVYARVVYGARTSLAVGLLVAAISVAIGLAIGLCAGYLRWLDGIVMRFMDGLMAIPAILLAIALVSLSSAGLVAVIVAIVVPEVPRVVRLVRSVVAEHTRALMWGARRPEVIPTALPWLTQESGIGLKQVFVGDDRLEFSGAEPVFLEGHRGIALHYRDADGHLVSYVVLPIAGFPVPDRRRVQIERGTSRWRPALMHDSGFSAWVWRQGDLACFVVSDIKIIQGNNGLFISMPSKKRKNGTFRDIAHPLNNETRRRLEEAIIAKYHEVLGEGGAALAMRPLEGGEGHEAIEDPRLDRVEHERPWS